MASPWPHRVVRDDRDLSSQLREFQPNVVVIETLDEQHRDHIGLAVEAGATSVYCEKSLATTPGKSLKRSRKGNSSRR